jgi:crotonobetainyl-CoA:carnitine CoA-transferase CaiB-like acyl-CoA transferase
MDSRPQQPSPQPHAGGDGPLAGYRVLDLSVNVLGPVATQILGDMGADIIKIESPDGDYTRQVGPSRSPKMGALFLNTNRNKRSVVLDLKKPGDKAALLGLVRSADVLVHSMRPGAAERLGVDYETIRAVNPRIIHASAPGFRLDSARRDWPAFDDVIQGASGIAGMMARATGEPRYYPTVIADKLCGYILASSIAMAFVWRERTGRGQQVNVPMMDAMVNFNLVEHLWGATLDRPDLGVGYSRVFSPHRRPYPTQDGHICVMAAMDSQWLRLFDAIGRPELSRDPRFATAELRTDHIDDLYGLLAEAISGDTTAEWRRRFDAADVPNGPVNSLEDLLVDPYLVETGFFQHSEHPTEGAYVTPRIPVQFSDSPGRVRRLPPRLGEHTEEVLSEIRPPEPDI